MLCEVPLTAEQRDFATSHHGLVYKFLNENRLPEDEFYDVVIFGYLKAVRDYFTDPTAQKYSFTTIANRRMRFCLCDHFRSQARKKRNMEVFSIHIGFGPDSYPLEETIAGQDNLMQQLEAKLLLHELARKVSRQQMDMVRLKTCGYNLREISRHQKTPMNRVKELLEEAHAILQELCYES
jgi:RNA polymerase sigma factor (sigma-70 family)